MNKFTVKPTDDPNAANAEIEVIASLEQSGNLIHVLCKLSTSTVFQRNTDGYKYASRCVLLAFEKAGYKIWHHSEVKCLMKADDGFYYLTGVFQKV